MENLYHKAWLMRRKTAGPYLYGPARSRDDHAAGLLAEAPPAASAAIAARRRRASYDDALVVRIRPGHAADVRIIDNDLPMVCCLPGRRRLRGSPSPRRC